MMLMGQGKDTWSVQAGCVYANRLPLSVYKGGSTKKPDTTHHITIVSPAPLKQGAETYAADVPMCGKGRHVGHGKVP